VNHHQSGSLRLDNNPNKSCRLDKSITGILPGNLTNRQKVVAIDKGEK
jgi:hypothetical protein